MTNQEKDRIECAIRHIQTAVDVDPWAKEIAVEAMKTQLSAEGTTSDLISRQDAIAVIEEMQMPIMRSMFPEEQFVFKGMSEALSAIKDLPSAQPVAKDINVPAKDCISRQAVIDRINKQREHLQPDIYPQDKIGDAAYRICAEFIERLPSAQSEIVRCKDCEHRDPEDKKCDCGHAILWQLPRQDDWYCADAERRTDGKN